MTGSLSRHHTDSIRTQPDTMRKTAVSYPRHAKDGDTGRNGALSIGSLTPMHGADSQNGRHGKPYTLFIYTPQMTRNIQPRKTTGTYTNPTAIVPKHR